MLPYEPFKSTWHDHRQRVVSKSDATSPHGAMHTSTSPSSGHPMTLTRTRTHDESAFTLECPSGSPSHHVVLCILVSSRSSGLSRWDPVAPSSVRQIHTRPGRGMDLSGAGASRKIATSSELILIHELVRELLPTRAQATQFDAASAYVCRRRRACIRQHRSYGSGVRDACATSL
jgi:hypothetical protein